MHSFLLEIAKPSLNGSLNDHQKDELSDEMDADQILQILMVLKEDGARRDEKIAQAIRQLEELGKFRDTQTIKVDGKFELITEEIRSLKTRLSAVESAGIAAWSTRKMAQWAAFISGVGVVWGGIVAAVIWLFEKVVK